MELLQRQLWIIRKIASTLKGIIADVKKDPAYLEMQTDSSSEDFGLILLDAQASALVIVGFFGSDRAQLFFRMFYLLCSISGCLFSLPCCFVMLSIICLMTLCIAACFSSQFVLIYLPMSVLYV